MFDTRYTYRFIGLVTKLTCEKGKLIVCYSEFKICMYCIIMQRSSNNFQSNVIYLPMAKLYVSYNLLQNHSHRFYSYV